MSVTNVLWLWHFQKMCCSFLLTFNQWYWVLLWSYKIISNEKRLQRVENFWQFFLKLSSCLLDMIMWTDIWLWPSSPDNQKFSFHLSAPFWSMLHDNGLEYNSYLIWYVYFQFSKFPIFYFDSLKICNTLKFDFATKMTILVSKNTVWGSW